MIRNFRHNGRRRFFERGERQRVPPEYADKIAGILSRLGAENPLDLLDGPGYGLHRLRGDFAGYWSVRVSANWRIIFRYDGVNVTDVDFIDYH